MAKYRFDWSALPAGLLRQLRRELHLGGGDPAEALKRLFGARPDEEFVRSAWPALRERWVAHDPVVRRSVVTALRARHLGDPIKLSGARSEVEYLRSCRNSPALRAVVLRHLVALGEEPPRPRIPATTDLRAKRPSTASTRSEAWDLFGDQLAGALAEMEAGQYLVVNVRGRPEYYVQFAQGGTRGLRAETASNANLEDWELLDEEAKGVLDRLGWRAPADVSSSGTTGGAPNYSKTWSVPVPYAAVAALAVRTFDEVLEVRRPEELAYRAFTEAGAELSLPRLAIAPERSTWPRPPTRIPSHGQLLQEVKAVMRTIIGADEVVVDEDGDIPVRVDGAMVFVRVHQVVPVVSVFSPVIWDMGIPVDIAETLNDMNATIRFARATWDGSGVTLAAEVVGAPLEAEQLEACFQAVATLAAEYAPKLQERYGGRVAFGPALPPKHVAVGGYL